MKTIEQWEKEKGLIVIDDIDPKQELSEAEFNKRYSFLGSNTVGVNHEDRIQFLEANGYEVTRENMINSELSAKEK